MQLETRVNALQNDFNKQCLSSSNKIKTLQDQATTMIDLVYSVQNCAKDLARKTSGLEKSLEIKVETKANDNMQRNFNLIEN